MDFHIIDKYYSKEDNLFHVIKEDTDDNSFFPRQRRNLP